VGRGADGCVRFRDTTCSIAAVACGLGAPASGRAGERAREERSCVCALLRRRERRVQWGWVAVDRAARESCGVHDTGRRLSESAVAVKSRKTCGVHLEARGGNLCVCVCVFL
jgi:hypothetical protein